MKQAADVAAGILGEHVCCALATHGKMGLTCCTMHYVPIGTWRIAMLTSGSARHVSNIDETGNCVLLIADAPRTYGQPARQLRISGEATVACPGRRGVLIDTFYHRFPAAREFFELMAPAQDEPIALEVTPVSANLLDERRYGPARTIYLSAAELEAEVAEK